MKEHIKEKRRRAKEKNSRFVLARNSQIILNSKLKYRLIKCLPVC